MANFLEDKDGNKSSKRASLISSLVNAVTLSWAVTGVLLYQKQYDLAVHTLEISWFAVFVLGGYVAAEFFAPKKPKNEDNN